MEIAELDLDLVAPVLFEKERKLLHSSKHGLALASFSPSDNKQNFTF